MLSCGVPDDRFRLEVQFKNLNQGDFYLYNYRNGTKDTLHISDGRCTYDVEMHDTTTYVLMFPNFSELPIFAQPGSLVKMEGDASHLKETSVTGTPDNDQMTAFRLASNELTLLNSCSKPSNTSAIIPRPYRAPICSDDISFRA